MSLGSEGGRVSGMVTQDREWTGQWRRHSGARVDRVGERSLATAQQLRLVAAGDHGSGQGQAGGNSLGPRLWPPVTTSGCSLDADMQNTVSPLPCNAPEPMTSRTQGWALPSARASLPAPHTPLRRPRRSSQPRSVALGEWLRCGDMGAQQCCGQDSGPPHTGQTPAPCCSAGITSRTAPRDAQAPPSRAGSWPYLAAGH